jgi:hypothetical protein
MRYKIMSFFRFYLLIALAFFASGLHAETPERKVTIRVIAFQQVGGIDDVFYRDVNGDIESVELSRHSFSHEIEINASDSVAFYSKDISGVPDPELATKESLIAEVSIPENLDEFLFIFAPTKDGTSGKYRIWPISSGNSEFNIGSMMFLNFSGNAMVARIGDQNQSLELPSGSPALIPFVGKGDRFNGNVQIAVYLENGWRKFYSSRWTIPKESKTVIMIFSDPRTGFPLLRSVSYKTDIK